MLALPPALTAAQLVAKALESLGDDLSVGLRQKDLAGHEDHIGMVASDGQTQHDAAGLAEKLPD